MTWMNHQLKRIRFLYFTKGRIGKVLLKYSEIVGEDIVFVIHPGNTHPRLTTGKTQRIGYIIPNSTNFRDIKVFGNLRDYLKQARACMDMRMAV